METDSGSQLIAPGSCGKNDMLCSGVCAPGAYAYNSFVLVEEGDRRRAAPVGGSMALRGTGEGSRCAGWIGLTISGAITTRDDIRVETRHKGIRLLPIHQTHISEAHGLLLPDKGCQLLYVGVPAGKQQVPSFPPLHALV